MSEPKEPETGNGPDNQAGELGQEQLDQVSGGIIIINSRLQPPPDDGLSSPPPDDSLSDALLGGLDKNLTGGR